MHGFAYAGRLVRAWIAIYTSGLPTEVRRARSDEIESDLWTQHAKSVASGQADEALASEVLTRLVTGMPADISWRIEQGRFAGRAVERTSTRGLRIAALLTIVGGLGWATAIADWALSVRVDPAARWWEDPIISVFGVAGLLALCISLGAIGWVLVNRYETMIGAAGLVGALGGICGLLKAYYAIVLVPVATVTTALYLARIRAVHWGLAVTHVASAPGLVIGLAAYSDSSLLGVATAFMFVYCLTWMGIGLELMRGLPRPLPAAQAT